MPATTAAYLACRGDATRYALGGPDALTGGAHIGRQGGPMLLTTGGDLHPSPKAYLNDQDSLEAVFLYGGTGVLSPTVQTSAAATLQ